MNCLKIFQERQKVHEIKTYYLNNLEGHKLQPPQFKGEQFSDKNDMC